MFCTSIIATKNYIHAKKTMFLSQKNSNTRTPGILLCSPTAIQPVPPCIPLTLSFNWFWVFELPFCYAVLFIIVHYCTYLQYHITWHIVVPAGGEPHHRIRLPPTPTNTTNIAALVTKNRKSIQTNPPEPNKHD